jgi:hypothetical protein
MAQQPHQDRRYQVKNSRTGETRDVTEQEYRDQNLEQAGFAKPDTAAGDNQPGTPSPRR